MRYAGARSHCSELTSGVNVDSTLLVGIDGARSGDAQENSRTRTCTNIEYLQYTVRDVRTRVASAS